MGTNQGPLCYLLTRGNVSLNKMSFTFTYLNYLAVLKVWLKQVRVACQFNRLQTTLDMTWRWGAAKTYNLQVLQSATSVLHEFTLQLSAWPGHSLNIHYMLVSLVPKTTACHHLDLYFLISVAPVFVRTGCSRCKCCSCFELRFYLIIYSTNSITWTTRSLRLPALRGLRAALRFINWRINTQ